MEGEDPTLFDAFLQYSLIVNSFLLYSRAAINAMLRRYIGFVRTDKAGSKPGLADVKWNLIIGAICFAAAMYSLYHVAIASDITQVRTYLPISMWMMFYSLILTSSILFVNDTPSGVPASVKASLKHRQAEPSMTKRSVNA
jgi:hypothetical protein